MAGFYSGFTQQNFTANGDASGIGYVDVADAALFEVGATVSLVSTGVAAAQYQVAAVDTINNRIAVRVLYTGTPRLNGQNYGLSSVSQYTTAQSAYVVQNVQFIYDESASGGESGGSGSLAIGNFGGVSSDGLILSSGVLNLTAANATNPGGVSTGSQTFAGAKTFTSALTAAGLTSSTNSFLGSAVDSNTYQSNLAASANGIAHIFRNNGALSGTAKIASFRNNNTEVASISFDSWFMGTSATGARFGSLFGSNFFGIRLPPADNTVYYHTGAVGGGEHRFVDSAGNQWGQIALAGITVGSSLVPTASLVHQYTNSASPAGNKTINKASGRIAIASGASSVVLTNSVITANAIVIPTLETPGAGVCNVIARPGVPGAGQCTFTSVDGTGAATVTTADATISFLVTKTE